MVISSMRISWQGLAEIALSQAHSRTRVSDHVEMYMNHVGSRKFTHRFRAQRIHLSPRIYECEMGKDK